MAKRASKEALDGKPAEFKVRHFTAEVEQSELPEPGFDADKETWIWAAEDAERGH